MSHDLDQIAARIEAHRSLITELESRIAALEAERQTAAAPETAAPTVNPFSGGDPWPLWERLQGCRIVDGDMVCWTDERSGLQCSTYLAANLFAYLTGATK